MAWGEAAAEHYLDRMAAADDLGTDPAEADRVARGEALRVACGVPPEHWPRTRGATSSDDLLAKAVALFGPRSLSDARPHDPCARFGE
jgi:hypothetical protein